MLLAVKNRDDWTRLRIHADDAGQRLDRFLRKLLPGCPLGLIFKFLRKGRIRVGEGKARPELRLEEGQEICFRMGSDELSRLGLSSVVARTHRAQQAGAWQEEAPRRGIRVVFEDEDILALDKPAGLPVHGGSGHEEDDLGLRVRAALRHFSTGESSHTFRPGPAHRLDRETTGLILFGKTARGLRALSELFRQKEIQKFYLALIQGDPGAASGRYSGTFREVVARRRDRPKLVPDEQGTLVHLTWRRLSTGATQSLVQVRLGTGKMHQIRAQFAAEGHPLVGDLRYGGGEPGRGAYAGLRPPRFLLHSSRLVFEHPFSGERMDLRIDVPEDFRSVLPQLGLDLPLDE